MSQQKAMLLAVDDPIPFCVQDEKNETQWLLLDNSPVTKALSF